MSTKKKPKYETIADEIRKRIIEHVYPLEHALPDEIHLAQEFEVSRMTMKRALEILVMEGLIYRKRGKGTFILQSSFQKDRINVISKETRGLTQVIGDRSLRSEVLNFEVKFPSQEVANHLMIELTEPVYEIRRVRYVDEEPYVIELTYMVANLITGITREILEKSVYAYIQEELGYTITSSHKVIRADKPDEYDQAYLKNDVTEPIIEVEQVVYLSNGKPFEYSFARHRYDKFVFSSVNIVK
ncbi:MULTISPECIES: GntR family transcriptional regulator [Exiguobacterium]|uniref:Transcriptional regulator, GntR family n=1 Tax=Exiguobacterium sp. (strain ATCC BAA-1283 / AT1b) TaxID=360911 RepID=C4L0F0_EXISA|nr:MULTISPECIES: GntR family transcriptional regulator [unclassified Exiguobacterium]ACQ70813.1 transcriptional regulator, GntR family [Exiguobacterium sp. AT1b]